MKIADYKKIRWRGALSKKIKKLSLMLESQKSAIVAFSGGVDSAFLAAMAVQTLSNRAIAVTSDSPSLTRRELNDAAALAKKLKIRHIIVKTGEMRKKAFTANSPKRCYYCKSELFKTLRETAEKENISCIIDGNNADDTNDYRPGTKAASEHNVKHPLQDAGFTKKDIRAASRALGLPTAEKPATACLSSRLPYGTPITEDALMRVEKSEAALHKLGFRQCRARFYGDTVRIEIPPDELQRAVAKRAAIVKNMQKNGFRYITLDLQGYRTGSLNEGLRGSSGGESVGR